MVKNYADPVPNGDGGNAAFVMAIVAVVLACFGFITLVIGDLALFSAPLFIASLALSVVALVKRSRGTRKSAPTMACSIVALALSVLIGLPVMAVSCYGFVRGVDGYATREAVNDSIPVQVGFVAVHQTDAGDVPDGVKRFKLRMLLTNGTSSPIKASDLPKLRCDGKLISPSLLGVSEIEPGDSDSVEYVFEFSGDAVGKLDFEQGKVRLDGFDKDMLVEKVEGAITEYDENAAADKWLQEHASDSSEGTSSGSADSDVPAEYVEALEKARGFAALDSPPVSKVGMYRLLTEYEPRFSPDAAWYAVNSLDVDWNEAALGRAQVLRRAMNMSTSNIYDALVSMYEFEPEEAQYAVDHME